MKRFDRLAIIGVGLIGGSVGLAARKVANEVVGAGSRPATLEAALSLGAITSVAARSRPPSPRPISSWSAPVGKIVELVGQIAPICRPGTLISDAGSTKAEIVTALDAAECAGTWGRDVHFVGSHPLAGNEKHGPQAARADLFVDRLVIVTPTAHSRAEDVQTLEQFWTGLGARVSRMSADDHDRAWLPRAIFPTWWPPPSPARRRASSSRVTASGWQDTTAHRRR